MNRADQIQETAENWPWRLGYVLPTVKDCPLGESAETCGIMPEECPIRCGMTPEQLEEFKRQF